MQTQTATTLSKRELAQQIKFRGCLATAIRHHRARNNVKADLRAAGIKVRDFSAREPCSLMRPSAVHADRVDTLSGNFDA
jgi:hypothetical protein